MSARPTVTLNRTKLADQAYDAIRAELLSGRRFLPGDKISVEDLARQLGVSRSPVWSAIARLEAEGMVDVRPRQGVFFIGFDIERLREIFTVRAALEGLAARLAAQRATPEEIAELERSITHQRALIQQGEIEAYTLEANRFHTRLTELSDNATLTDLVTRLWTRSTAMCLRRNRKGGDFDERTDEHVEMVAAVARHDSDAAEAITRHHIHRLADSMRADDLD
jgi:DNA-binding GntR family transcriptional regulator